MLFFNLKENRNFSDKLANFERGMVFEKLETLKLKKIKTFIWTLKKNSEISL